MMMSGGSFSRLSGKVLDDVHREVVVRWKGLPRAVGPGDPNLHAQLADVGGFGREPGVLDGAVGDGSRTRGWSRRTTRHTPGG